MNTPLTIPKKVVAAMITHALERDPEECCGILFGKHTTVEYIRKVENVHRGDKVCAYTMDARQMTLAEGDARKRGLMVVAYYHSHTFSEGPLSPTDIQKAVESARTEPFYVLISVKDKFRPVVRAFKISSIDDVAESKIQV